jgi:hypothetical protein
LIAEAILDLGDDLLDVFADAGPGDDPSTNLCSGS